MIPFYSSSPQLQRLVLASMSDDLDLVTDWDCFMTLSARAACAVVAIDGAAAGPDFDLLTTFTRVDRSTPIVLILSDIFRDGNALGRVDLTPDI